MSVLRVSGRRVAVPGWFPLVVERLHPHVSGESNAAEAAIEGVRMRLDLNDYTQRRIFYGAHEPGELAFTRRILRSGDVVLDVGAHVGLFSLVAAAAVGGAGEVHSFEPVPASFAALEENIELNGFSQIRALRAAVGALPGQVELGLGPHEEAGSGGYTLGGTGKAVTADLIRLDDYALDLERPVRLLKIDVEGLEPDVLAGYSEGLSARPPDAVLAEVSPEALALHGRSPDDLLEPLEHSGYGLYRVSRRGRLRALGVEQRRRVREPLAAPSGEGGLVSLVRQGLRERSTFFNVVALRPGVSV